MAENVKTQAVPAETENTEDARPTRLQVFVSNHPRAAKVLAIVGVTGTAVGAVTVAKTVSANRKHVDQALGHTQAAMSELSTAVTPQEVPEA